MRERTTTAKVDKNGRIYVPKQTRRMLDIDGEETDVEIRIRIYDEGE